MTSKKARPPKNKRKPATATAVEITVNGTVGGPFLRQLAEAVFATDQAGLTLDQLHQRPEFRDVPLATIYRWSADDKWQEKRRVFIEGWKQQIQRRIGDQLVQTRLSEMGRMQKVYDIGMKKLEDGLAQANSWEGVAAVLIRIADLIDKWRESVAMHVGAVPQAMGHSHHAIDPSAPLSVPAIRPRLSEDEAKEAAKMIMRKRREQMRAALASGDKSE